MFFDEIDLALNPNRKSAKGKKAPFVKKDLRYPNIVNIPYVEFTDAELEAAFGCELECDTEVYPNYTLIAFKCSKTKRVALFEMAPQWGWSIDEAKMNWILRHFQIITFNGKKFDDAIIWATLAGCNNTEVKSISDKLIIKDEDTGKKRYFVRDACKEFGFEVPRYNHVDLFELTALRPGLKTLAGRLHASRMQDLPYDPAKELTLEEAINVRHYCVNDLDVTAIVKEEVRSEIQLREQLSDEYSLDLRSYSDAQIAEHVLYAEVSKALGYKPRRPIIPAHTVYKYDAPAFVGFQTPMMREVFEGILSSDFVISEKGQPKNEYLKGLKIKINETTYTMGVGGLHSTEKKKAHYAKDGYMLIDRDVASYYPYIILNNGFFPKHLTAVFLDVYRKIVERRLEAKALSKSKDKAIAKMNKIIADALKITINGSFGKLGSMFSNLYSPDLLIQVTLTGQLALLMLIEALELVGIQVVSANTDGIVIKCHESKYDQLNMIVKSWEEHTSFETEETQYSALFSRDVNNYIAIKKGGEEWKGKGRFGEASRKKQPTAEVCATAVAEYLMKGTPISETILNQDSLTGFITVKNVRGGGEKDGLYLGKAVRWYYAKGDNSAIHYVKNGNTVGGSYGGKPCMDLPTVLPSDINYDWYINAAEDMLTDIGFYAEQRQVSFSLFDDEELDSVDNLFGISSW